MIPITDLRIGNHVLYKPYGNRDGQPVRIEGLLGMKAFFNKHSNENGMFHNLQPIPLTEEWLERMGFAKQYRVSESEREYYVCGKVMLGLLYPTEPFTEFSINLSVYGDAFSAHLGRMILNVHQLQNLFYSLCGEELKVNL